MRACPPRTVASFIIAAACMGWSFAGLAVAQGVYPAEYGQPCDAAAEDPGPYAYPEQCEYPVFPQYGEQCPCGPRWTFVGETIVLQRSNTRSQSLFLSSRTADELLNSKNLNFPMEFGPKAGVIRHGIFGSDYDVEAAYFHVNNFEASAFLPDNSRMVIDVNDAFLSTDSTARYESALYCGEINVRWQWLDWLTLLSGFRMIELNEEYNAFGTGTQTQTPVLLDVKAYNHMYGYQLGAVGEIFNLGGPLQIEALCKAGVYGNFADQNIRAANVGFIDQTLSAAMERVSFMGEIGLTAKYAITERLAFRASYQAMWLTGVALAPEQIDVSNFTLGATKVNLDGGVFYHGGGMGFECRF